MKDKLFLMQPGFRNAGLGPYYCGDSAPVEGLLGFFPELRDKIDVEYIAFPRPRQAIVDLVGEDNQSVPVLVLAEGSETVGDIEAKSANGHRYLDNEKQIRQYLSVRHGLPTAG